MTEINSPTGSAIAFQDQIPNNGCFGCGPDNEQGLRIKSFWSGSPDSSQESICRYHPEPHQAAGPSHVLNGGIIASLIDCHTVCTATAEAYRRAGREIGAGQEIWYVTGTLTVKYLRPTPIDRPVELRATIKEVGEKKTRLLCTLLSEGEPAARAEIIAIRVPDEWREAGDS